MNRSSVASWLVGLSIVVSSAAAVADSRRAPASSPPRAHARSVTAGLDCSACHTPAGWKSIGAASGSAGFDHSKTGFPLTERHRSAACTDCHRSDRPITRECAGCHQDAHAGRLSSRCDSCHSAAGWLQTEALARHRLTRLPLTGMHALVECRDCHARTVRRQWTTPPADCYGCHALDYQRPDVHPVHRGGPDTEPFPRDCTVCHRTTGWSPALVPASSGIVSGAFALTTAREHDRHFPLSFGAHRGAACASCHTAPSQPRAVRCTGCHAHSQVRLAQDHERVTGRTGARCLSCHRGGARR